jgi:hypothetical protein
MELSTLQTKSSLPQNMNKQEIDNMEIVVGLL